MTLRSVAIVVALAGGLTACSSPDVSYLASPDPALAYRALTLQAHAITMSIVAPYDTLQLVATARSGLGTPLADAPAPTFVTTDSSVRVSTTGLLTARAVRSNVLVIASLTYQGIRLADTAIITVTNVTTPQRVARLVLQPKPGDDTTYPVPTFGSFVYGVSGTKVLDVEAQDISGMSISGALVALSTSVPVEVTFPGSPFGPSSVTTATTSGFVNLTFSQATSLVGSITLRADATIYGATMRDSLVLTLLDPILAVIRVDTQARAANTQVVHTVSPSVPVTISTGGFVWWWNNVSDSLDIEFDDSTMAAADVRAFNSGGGNIPPFTGCSGGPLNQCLNIQSRQFLRPGSVRFHSVKTGVSGTIIVR